MPRKPRRAKLTIESDPRGVANFWTRLTGRNGEVLDVSETTERRASAVRMRAARLRAYIDVLEDEGLVVLTHGELDELMRAAVEAEDKVRAVYVVTKPEEAGR